MSIIVQQDAIIRSLLCFCKLLYMFRVVTPPIIRSLCYLPLSWSRLQKYNKLRIIASCWTIIDIDSRYMDHEHKM